MASWLIPFLPCWVNIDINLDEPFTPTFAPAQCELGISIWSSSVSVLVCFLLCTSSTIDPSILSPVLQHAPISKKTRASPIDLCQVPITWGEKRIFLGTQKVGNKKWIFLGMEWENGLNSLAILFWCVEMSNKQNRQENMDKKGQIDDYIFPTISNWIKTCSKFRRKTKFRCYLNAMLTLASKLFWLWLTISYSLRPILVVPLRFPTF